MNGKEISIIGRIDNDRKKRAYVSTKRSLEPKPMAPRDCRECAYAKVHKDGAVRCQQKQWKDITWFRDVEIFMRHQRLNAVTCNFYHHMGD